MPSNMILHAQWNTGWLIAMYTLTVLVILFTAFTAGTGVYWILMGRNDPYSSLSGPGFLVGLFFTLLCTGILVWVAFPFSGVYHRYQPVSGSITQNVSSRFLSDGGGGTTQNYLVQINGNDYRCDDTRCSGLTKGTKITLMCEKTYQFNGTAGWVCNWGKLGTNR